jgi:Na+-translocating ferredoxin:NAD+ oxidoreductase RnfG subunit
MKIFKTALVLTLIGIACGLLIGLSNMITAPIIEENARKAELKA